MTALSTVTSEAVTTTDPTKLIDGSLIAAEKVIDTNVYDPQGEKLGDVDDLMIDKTSGRVAYAVLSFGGFPAALVDPYLRPRAGRLRDFSRQGDAAQRAEPRR